MALLSVAVAVLTALVLLDLILTGAVIRRLRETEKRLIEITTPPDTGMRPGDPMPEFTSPDGGLSRADLAGTQALIGFFSAGCHHCPAQADRLAARADDLAAMGITVVSVLTVTAGDTDELSPRLEKAGRLIVETGTSDMMNAFQAEATPTFLLFDDAGVLLNREHGLDDVLGGK
ncbi:hypothetical protein Aca07nite_03480 [Actinoplanes capillaceus]|uniref:Thioredoxin domain-containing protein n=1 Tax=Actinoplanes campanulatus TaxID=113559 RepID=A0ABQ3WA79_9ACTN|nr:redoxin domain-containing protein [Actinoplanes capillaceus]GID43073.1 hypothetical protein Aca07nite_03480 [Actinoplanes capillaceus]